MRKSSVTVLVDDYVSGRMPEVCVATGVTTDDQVKLRTNVARVSQLWFLTLFLGPVGWIVLAFVLWRTRNVLEGWLPYLHREVLLRRSRRRAIAAIAGVVVAGALLLYLALGVVLLLWLCALAIVGATIALTGMSIREPRIRLDASGGRLVISRCHPRFAEAVERMPTEAIDSQI